MFTSSTKIFIQAISGSRKLSNLFWASLLFLGALAFFFSSLSSYLHNNLIGFLSVQNILFKPQGLVMGFYGIGGLFFSFSLLSAILWNIGSGYNEYDMNEGVLHLFRWGFPGYNRRIRIRCFIEDIKAIQLHTNFFLAKYSVSLELRNGQSISLSEIDHTLTLTQIENQAAQLSQFLRIPMKGI